VDVDRSGKLDDLAEDSLNDVPCRSLAAETFCVNVA